jgi:demethoxyubiquinone hydroxylase (CLK1/Coq7/Cat5 family)
MVAERAVRKQRGRPFVKGRSGNPAGRPPGSRNKSTMAAEALLDGEAETITRKAIERAMNGDPTALRLCLERVIPARKDRPVRFELPQIKSIADAVGAAAALLAAVAAGDLTPSEAADIGKLVDSYLQSIEATEFEQRLARIEKGNDDEGFTS